MASAPLSLSLALMAITGVLAPPSEDAPVPTAEAPDQPAGDSRSAAKQAFDEGLDAAAKGNYETAIAAFMRAHELHPHPVTLFNLALTLEKAQRLPEAWELFDEVVTVVESAAERREIRRHMQAIEAQIAIVEVTASPRSRLCIDGVAMPKHEGASHRLAVEPGRHELLLDAHPFPLEIQAGERRVLLLDAGGSGPDSPRGRAVPALLGTTVGAGALGLGLGIGAATSRDGDVQLGLASGAAASAGVAMITGLTALLIERRIARGRPPKSSKSKSKSKSSKSKSSKSKGREAAVSCPGSPTLEQRIDLQLDTATAHPVTFAAGALPPPAIPGVQLAERPFPRGHAAPREPAEAPLTPR
ncbi:tetratricopeptide repeat protein [Pseudenhygromyxa sp. WMMC2535]|uniref:tetratricopeptide repeat protein n=1 Tax=Pseudenhygromyxa sp. WMMC2535 TaxID=2712867 RepID=UPI001553DBCD|nr:tetratricopeptide repeat protein [Pseudenhygromyxa sp. WMMC2535]NVB42231.1 tetratricopeptide repeat protein [Pseudenhygromyxa sp. WMMC2535]